MAVPASYAIIHEAPSAGAISELEVARVEADSESAALVAWFGERNSGREPKLRTRARDGRPCIDYGFGDVILRQYTAIERSSR